MNFIKNKFINTIYFIFVLLLFSLPITQYKIINETSEEAIGYCIKSLIPSLFFTLVISLFIIESNLYFSIGKFFKLIAKYIFAMPEYVFSIFIISNFSGYPVGIKLLHKLKEKKLITNDDFKYLSCICFSGGPSFILSVTDNTKIGIPVFFSIFISNCITAIIICHFHKLSFIDNIIYKTEITSKNIILSISSSAKSMVGICSMTIFFTAIINILNLSDKFNFIPSLIEICQLKEFYDFNYKNVIISTGCLTFGGICVLFQIIQLSENQISICRFLLVRVFNSVLSMFFCSLYFRFNNDIFSKLENCFSNSDLFFISNFQITNYSFILLSMSVMLLYKIETKSY